MPQLDINNMTFESLLNIEDTTDVYESEYPELDLLEAINECADIECELLQLEKASIIIEGAERIQKVQYEADENQPAQSETQEKPAESNTKTEEAKKGLGEKIKGFVKKAWEAIVNLWHKLVATVLNFFKINKNYYDKNKEVIGKNFDKVINDFNVKPNPALIYAQQTNSNYQKILQDMNNEFSDTLKKYESYDSVDDDPGVIGFNEIPIPKVFDDIEKNKNENNDSQKYINMKIAIPNTSVLEWLIQNSYKIAKDCDSQINKIAKKAIKEAEYQKDVGKEFNDKTKSGKFDLAKNDLHNEEIREITQKIEDKTKKNSIVIPQTIKNIQKITKAMTASIYKIQPTLLKIMKACVKGKTDSSEEKKEENK